MRYDKIIIIILFCMLANLVCLRFKYFFFLFYKHGKSWRVEGVCFIYKEKPMYRTFVVFYCRSTRRYSYENRVLGLPILNWSKFSFFLTYWSIMGYRSSQLWSNVSMIKGKYPGITSEMLYKNQWCSSYLRLPGHCLGSTRPKVRVQCSGMQTPPKISEGRGKG